MWRQALESPTPTNTRTQHPVPNTTAPYTQLATALYFAAVGLAVKVYHMHGFIALLKWSGLSRCWPVKWWQGQRKAVRWSHCAARPCGIPIPGLVACAAGPCAGPSAHERAIRAKRYEGVLD